MIELDKKIETSVNNCKILHKRSTFILLGSRATENVPVIFFIRNFNINDDTKILWCFKRENSFIKRSGKNTRKFEKSCKKMNLNNEKFDNFTFMYDISWCHYNDTDNVLGTTFDAVILQDFDCLTPNKIAKVIETVKGGGLIIFLLPNINDISELGSLSMDCHKKYQTFAYNDVDYRFNYRFFYSLIDFQDCFLLDNNLQILPINWHLTKSISAIDESEIGKKDKSLLKLKKKLKVEYKNWENIIDICATRDQTHALISLIGLFKSKPEINMTIRKPKSNRNPFLAMVTSGRGRGKSALLGMAIAVGIHNGMSRIFVTSPIMENVVTLMQFVINGLVKFGYEENRDFVRRCKPIEGVKCQGIVEIELVKHRQRQVVRYLSPNDHRSLDKIDLLCIDETAAIPLPIVKKLMAVDSDFVFMSSTMHGYEGTGRSLSLKLMKQIREGFTSDDRNEKFLEISLKEPIRYSKDDNVERWMNNLLCLDCENELNDSSYSLNNNQPSLNDCQLFYINRDVLFSCGATSERFLQRIMGIYVSSHYKNTPNDLQMLSDCSSHALFCLAKPVLMDDGLPIVCAVLQIAFEGSIDPVIAKNSLEKGVRPSGDMIPWTIVQQFNQYDFVKLAGARIVRIAVHPSFQRQGYGGHALKLLYDYFNQEKSLTATKVQKTTLHDLVKSNSTYNNFSTVNTIPPVDKLGHLLVKLADIPPESLDYISVSFGLTSELLRFWKKNNFIPIYLRQTINDTTGEHSCVMMRQLPKSELVEGQSQWLQVYNNDFIRRFCNLLPGPFKNIDSVLVLELIHQKSKVDIGCKMEVTPNDLITNFTANDFSRLDNYVKGVTDYHGIMDLVHRLSILCHTKKFPNLKLPKFQDLVLVSLGLQYKTVDELVEDLAAFKGEGLKMTTGSEILGHLKESLKSLTKSIKIIMK